jgi:hypothetical protein
MPISAVIVFLFLCLALIDATSFFIFKKDIAESRI